MPTHPDARCGQCDACKYVDATKSIVLAHSAPSGPGIGDQQREMWNKALEDNPCHYPLVVVHLQNPPATVKGRITAYNGTVISVNTVERGTVLVDMDKTAPWTPLKCLEGIGFEQLCAALETTPQTWLPALLASLAKTVIKQNVFMPFGASTMIRELEVKLLGNRLETDQTSGLVNARASLKGKDLLEFAKAILNTPDLNVDELDDLTRPVIRHGRNLIREIETGK